MNSNGKDNNRKDYLAKISHYGNGDGERMQLNEIAEENAQNSLMEEKQKNQNNNNMSRRSEEGILMGWATPNGGAVDESAEQNNNSIRYGNTSNRSRIESNLTPEQ